MNFKLLKNVDVRYLDRLLTDQGNVHPVRSDVLRQIPPEHLQAWCVKRGVYQIPTWELLAWLRREIDGRSAIEICAGQSCLGRHLGIPMIDNFMHVWPAMRAIYAKLGQEPSIPSADVKCMDANEAVRVYRPEVVIGAWVTQKRYGNEKQANAFGPDEHEIVINSTYIHIGNLGAHGSKRILIRPHRELRLPWLFGRGLDPKLNRIWVWDHDETAEVV